MSTLQKTNLTVKSISGSTNGTLNVILAFSLAFAVAFGIPEDTMSTFVLAAVPIFGFLREIFKGIRNIKWSGNIITYLVTGLTLLVPWLADAFNILGDLANALILKDWGAVLLLVVPLINVILALIKNKPWEQSPAR